MKRLLWLTLCLRFFHGSHAAKTYYWPEYYVSHVEKYHYPGGYTSTMSPFINGTDEEIVDPSYSPDFRLEEPHFTAYDWYNKEYHRPYRLSPHLKQTWRFKSEENPSHYACYCGTVFRRYHMLGGCLVITTRHVLTTATSTDIVLRNFLGEKNLEGILGIWYDTDSNVFNSSLYATPCRIHYHGNYIKDYEVNASHPIPCMYDLALWAATYRFSGYFMSYSGAVICHRAVSSWAAYQDPIPRVGDLHSVIGFQFMKAYARRPMPWFKYAIRTANYVNPCPKTEWHWFICLGGEDYALYGMDSGAGLHFHDRSLTWRIDGSVGINAFSMDLRAKELTHYFTVLDTYPVLDWLYYAMMAYQKCVYIDYRFEDSKYRAPVLYWGEYIPNDYIMGKEYFTYEPPTYRR